MAWVDGDENSNYIIGKDGVTEDMDIIQGFGGHDTIFGLGGNDFIYGGNGDDDLFGDGGNDFLQGGVGYDDLDGGVGIDDAADYADSWEGVAVTLGSGGSYGWGTGGTAEGDTLIRIETLRGSWFDDYLVGNEQNNALVGQAGNDTLKGGGGSDYLIGFQDNDTLKGGGQADALIGGDGIDTAAYNDSPAGVFVSLITETGSGGDAEGDWLRTVENLTGSVHGDTLVGNHLTNVLTGLDGNDILKGFGGADTLYGEGGSYGAAGNDYLDGGTGIDLMVGGLGNDTYIVDEFFDAVTEWGEQGFDVVRTSVNWTMTWDAEIEWLETTNPTATTGIFLVGNLTSNRITGNDGDNAINGGGGNDHMIGRNGNDTYYVDSFADSVAESGGQGMDEVRTSVNWTLTAGADVELLRTTDDWYAGAIDLTGNASGNTVRGNHGNNIINGGDGNDTLIGLVGEDSFLFDTALRELNPDGTIRRDNVDIIEDFNVAADTIRLDNDIFTAMDLALGSVAGSQFVIGTAALDAGDRIIYDSVSGAVWYDPDGTAGGTASAPQVQFATLPGGLALTNHDFFVVD